MSMAWLRGKELEVSAASNPTQLYGRKTICSYLGPDASDSVDKTHTCGVIINKDFEGRRYWGNIEQKSIWKNFQSMASMTFA